MKATLLISSLLFSTFLMADMEHKPGIGAVPVRQKLTKQRGCFQEIRNLGCGHPREDQTFFNTCLSEKSDQLSSECLTFFEKLYGKRN